MTQISKELKQAIEEMPDKEKNQLLLRLIKKDAMLVSQLEFKLLGSDSIKDEAKQELLEQIGRYRFYGHTPGLVMMEMRDFSGAISRYYKITKDKVGEIELLLQLLINGMEKPSGILNRENHRAGKFAEYVIKKALIIFDKLHKLHQDLYLEFAENVNRLLKLIENYPPTKRCADKMRLPKTFEI